MATLVSTRTYSLNDFKNKENSGNIPELESLVIEKINKLASRVGAPSYQKTPVFKRYNYNTKKKKVNENITSMIGKQSVILKLQHWIKIWKVLKHKWIKLEVI